MTANFDYIKDEKASTLLTAEQEVELSKAFKKEVPNPDNPDKPKLVVLDPLTYQAKKARDTLVAHNLRLVISIAKRYTNCNMEFTDLIQEGNIGLMKAADKFDHRKGYKFSTYACVPTSTQILTKRGWKFHHELVEGDETLGYNNGETEWTTIRGSVAYEDAPLVNFGNTTQWNIQCTDEHKWLIEEDGKVNLSPLSSWPDKKEFLWPTKHIVDGKPYKRRNTKLVLGAPNKGGDSELTPDEAAILAWVLSDGSLYDNPKTTTAPQASIIQNNDKFADEITELLKRNNAYCSDTKRKNSNCLSFHISSEVFQRIWDKSKLATQSIFDLVIELSSDARKAWFEAWYKAEGTLGTNLISQNKGPKLNALELTLILEGKENLRSRPRKNSNRYTITWHSRPRTPRNAIVKPSNKAKVWCPNTDLGTWTAKDENGYIFLTGNSYWIKQSITRAIADQSRLIRIPVHITEYTAKIARAYKELSQTKQHITPADIARITDVPLDKIKLLFHVMKQPVSLAQQISDTDLQLEELIADEDSLNHDPELYDILLDNLYLTIQNIPAREKVVVLMRNAIGSFPKSTLEVVGNHLDITRERVRQIEMRAWRRIRADYILDKA